MRFGVTEGSSVYPGLGQGSGSRQYRVSRQHCLKLVARSLSHRKLIPGVHQPTVDLGDFFFSSFQLSANPLRELKLIPNNKVLLQLGAGAKKAPFLLCDQRYVPVLSGRLEYPANNHCIRIRVTIGKHRALPLPQ